MIFVHIFLKKLLRPIHNKCLRFNTKFKTFIMDCRKYVIILSDFSRLSSRLRVVIWSLILAREIGHPCLGITQSNTNYINSDLNVDIRLTPALDARSTVGEARGTNGD